jgi:hypothetical protein
MSRGNYGGISILKFLFEYISALKRYGKGIYAKGEPARSKAARRPFQPPVRWATEIS